MILSDNQIMRLSKTYGRRYPVKDLIDTITMLRVQLELLRRAVDPIQPSEKFPPRRCAGDGQK